VGVDVENNWWVLETRSGKWTTGQLIEEMFAVNAQWHPITMTLEVIGQAQGIMLPIHDEENRRNIYLPLKEITARAPIRKEIRIRSVLQPRFERGKVFIKNDMFDLEEQILKFPRGKRDDMVDCMTDIEDIAFTPDGPTEGFKETGSHLQDLANKKMTQAPEYDDPFLSGYW
jgi:phage terminase large subunit-like protein